MDSETNNVSTVYLAAYYFAVIGGIATVGIFGMINLYNDHFARGIGLLIAFMILLRLFVWLEKANQFK